MMNIEKYFAYIGTNSVRGSQGIYTLSINAQTLQPEVTSVSQAYNSGSLALSADEQRIYAVAEGMTFRGLADGGVTGFAVAVDGSLTEQGGERTHGQRPCCVTIDEQNKSLYTCSFFEGTLCNLPLAADGRPLPARLVIDPPEGDHFPFKSMHCVKAVGSDHVAAISLNRCALMVYSAADGRCVTEFAFPGNPFPRYLETIGDCVYAMMQDPGDIYVFRSHLDAGGGLELLQKVSVQPEGFSGPFGTSTIRVTPDSRLLLAATRRANTLSVFRIMEDGTLALGDVVKLPGETPRDFHISRDGRIVVTALQRSDEVCVHEIDYDIASLVYRGGKVSVPSPAAVAVSGRCSG